MIPRLSSQEKTFNPNLSSAVFWCRSCSARDTSGYDSHCCSAPSLARAGLADSQVDNAPFCHTSCQPGVSVAATPSTLPQRVKNANQLTARWEHLWEPLDHLIDRTDLCDHHSPTSAVVTIMHCEKSHIARNCDPTSVDCTATTPRWGTPPSRDGVEPPRLRLDSTTSPAPRRGYPLSTVGQCQISATAPSKSKELGFLLLTITVIVVQSWV